MNWQSIVIDTVSIFGHWALVAGVYYIAKFAVKYSLRHKEGPATLKDKVLIYGYCAGICVLFSVMIASQMGTHQEGGDYYRDPGETVIDFEPTSKERLGYGTKNLLVFLPASILGAYVVFRRDAKLTVEERQKRNYELTKPIRDHW